MKKISLLATSFILGLSFAVADPTPPQYPTLNNVFISYFSTDNVKAMMKYINDNKLKGFILWEVRGDMPYDHELSLLAAANKAIDTKNPPMIMGYWSDWTVYGSTNRFYPTSITYGIPGSIDSVSGNAVNNPDLQAKLEGLNILTYDFLEAEPAINPLTNKPNAHPGTLYFADPWSDLQSGDYAFCTKNTDICYTEYLQQDRKPPQQAFTMPTDQTSFNLWVKMGNFPAFSHIKHNNNNNPLGPLKKIMSVGGYGHDKSFEDAMSNPTYITNFVNSAVTIINNYGLEGIDLDYENPNMTPAQSVQFQILVDKLASSLPQGKEIYLTMLANPAHMSVSKDAPIGFETGVLQHIAAEVTGVNLMTYDFHGAFDYNGGKGKTGFITNINPVATDTSQFSVVAAVKAALNAGVPANKLSVGIPAYGRALQGIASDNGGYNQLIPDVAIPRGNLDTPDCKQDIANLNFNSCSASFEYQFIHNYMLGNNGFTEKAWPTEGGTTAYADTWTYKADPSSAYTLNIVNSSPALGINVTITSNNGGSFASDYLAPGASKLYPASALGAIENQKGLNVIAINYKEKVSCKNTFDFTKNSTVTITQTNITSVACDYK